MSRPNWNSGQVSNWGRNPQIVGGGARPLLSSGAHLDGTGLIFPAVLTGNTVTTPDSAALDITGDVEIVARLSKNDWSAGGQSVIAAKDPAGFHPYALFIQGVNLQFYASATGSSYVLNNVASTIGVPFSNGDTGWVRATLDLDNGSGNYELKFFTAADQSTEPTVWTQLGTTRTGSVITSLFAGSGTLQIGSLVDSNFKRVIIRNGIGGTVAFDADFASQTANALAFTESSANAATVTINTTRYTYGLPNVQWQTSNVTESLTANRVHYQPFLVTAPIYVDGTRFNVTSGPASAANVRTGIYLADSNCQPVGAPVLDAGDTAVGTSATGTFFTQVTPVLLQPGMYVTAINTSVALTVRVQRGGIVGTDVGNGASSIISLMYAAQTQGAFPNPGTAWNVRTFAATAPNHYLSVRWYAA